MTAGDAGQTWSARALAACLDHLGVSGVTDARCVSVHSSWTDGPTAFCIVYSTPWSTDDVGLRRDAADAKPAAELMSWLREPSGQTPVWDHHNMMTSGYDMNDEAVVRAGLPDPVGFGRNVADFDIGEPHAPAPGDPVDDAGVRWHGNLTDGIPRRP